MPKRQPQVSESGWAPRTISLTLSATITDALKRRALREYRRTVKDEVAAIVVHQLTQDGDLDLHDGGAPSETRD
jgi:hypothetical protein